MLTFPTKFDMVEPILNLNHNGKIIVRMSMNPQEIINRVEFGTSRLDNRIKAINKLKIIIYIKTNTLQNTRCRKHTNITGRKPVKRDFLSFFGEHIDAESAAFYNVKSGTTG